MTSFWLHGASVGDMRALHPVYRGLKKAHPDSSFWVTAWTTQGRQLGQQSFDGASVTRPPLPMFYSCHRALHGRHIRCAIFEYLELWPTWTRACERLDVPMIILDGRITQKTLRIAPLLKRAAARITAFCAQTEADAEAAVRLGVMPSRIHVMGNAKFDGFPAGPVAPSPDLYASVGLRDVVVGSLHPDEEKDFVRACAYSTARILVAPRYLNRVDSIYRCLLFHIY